jgi:hypothetical protein
MADSTDDAVISGTPQVFFLRNPEVPTTYSPLVDVRVGQNGLHLLSFVPPAAAPADLEMRNGQPSIVVRSHSEIMVPLDGVERLIRDLCSLADELARPLHELRRLEPAGPELVDTGQGLLLGLGGQPLAPHVGLEPVDEGVQRLVGAAVVGADLVAQVVEALDVEPVGDVLAHAGVGRRGRSADRADRRPSALAFALSEEGAVCAGAELA